MATMWTSLVFSNDGVGALHTAMQELSPSHLASSPVTRQMSVKLIDTFDWALDRKGMKLLVHQGHSGSEMILLEPESSLARDVQLPHTMWLTLADITDRYIRGEIANVAGTRALLTQAETVGEVSRYRYLNSQGLAVSTVWLYRFPSTNRCSVLLLTKRGYRGFHQRIAKQLAAGLSGSGMTVTLGDPFDQLLEDAHRSRRDYQSRFTLQMDPAQLGCVAFGRALSSEQSRIKANAPWIRDHPDPEFLHDFRVALRRTISLIKSLDPLYAPIDMSGFRGELKFFIGVTSPVRDLENLFQVAGHLRIESAPGLDQLRSRISSDLNRSYLELADLLESPRFEDLVANWGKMSRRCVSLSLVTRPPPRAAGRSDGLAAGGVIPTTMVVDSANALLPRAGLALVKTAKKAKRLKTPESLHALRKQAKSFRYLLEFYEPVLATTRVRQIISLMKRLQDALGQHQDSVVQVRLLRTICERNGIAEVNVGELFKVLESSRKTAIKNYKKEIAAFSGPSLLDEIQLAIDHRKR